MDTTLLNATAGLAKVTQEINERGLAGDCKIGLIDQVLKNSSIEREKINSTLSGSVSAFADALSRTHQMNTKAVNIRPAIW